MKVNPGALTLQAQLQAQLQAATNSVDRPNRSAGSLAAGGAAGDDLQGRKSAPSKGPLVSTERELAKASENAKQFAEALQREAPVGRLSEQAAQQRNIPLGQVIDILV